MSLDYLPFFVSGRWYLVPSSGYVIITANNMPPVLPTLKEKALRKDTQITRTRLVDAAERLFADQGIDCTSLLDVAKAAEQKNRSALQYHFKNKEGLINAVLDKHSAGILEHRTEMLEKLEQKSGLTIYEVVEAVVMPLAALLDSKNGGSRFLKIHRELMLSDKYSSLRKQRSTLMMETYRILTVAEPFIKDIEADELSARIVLVDCLMTNGLVACMSEDIRISRSAFLHTLMQGIVSLLIQPSSPT